VVNEKDLPQTPATRADRKLGDEWENWDGTAASDRSQAPAWIFLALAFAVAAGLMLTGWAVAWLVAPRFSALGLTPLPWFVAGFWTAYLALWDATLWLGTLGVKFLRPCMRKLGGIRWMIGPAVVLGKLLGVSRDQVGHAFVLIHNRLEVFPPVISEAGRLLILVPRCLSRETIQGLAVLKEQYGFTQITATGGTEARRAIAQLRPQGIVAVACERDLLSGVRDVKGRVPVLAFANQRPEGPCKNTRVDLGQIETALRLLLKKA